MTAPSEISLYTHKLPVICSPMFMLSDYRSTIAQCLSGVIGTFPSLNARPEDQLTSWCSRIEEALRAARSRNPDAIIAPYGVNLILHQSNLRMEHDLKVLSHHKIPLLITSLRAPREIVQEVHAWGGLIFHDVISKRHAEKAAETGADGLVLVCAGAGGHTGTLNPFAFLAEVRQWFTGKIILAGALSSGRDVLAARLLGADFVYMGTRFIATQEMQAPDAYKQIILESSTADIFYSSYFTGILGNYLAKSIERAGLNLETLKKEAQSFSFSEAAQSSEAPKAWRDIWSAGHGVGTISDIPSTSALVERLCQEYEDAKSSILDL